MILLIDNYDSFTYNLYQYVEELGFKCRVVRNDKITLQQIQKQSPGGILLSPGPGIPSKAGICLELIQTFSGKIPLFGVCLGHQAIGEAFGAQIIRAGRIMHGKLSDVYHKKEGVFRGLNSPFQATRYHSLVISPSGFPKTLKITAKTKDGVIMGIRHRKHSVEGVQFHPESIMTPDGHQLLLNFLKRTSKRNGKSTQ